MYKYISHAPKQACNLTFAPERVLKLRICGCVGCAREMTEPRRPPPPKSYVPLDLSTGPPKLPPRPPPGGEHAESVVII